MKNGACSCVATLFRYINQHGDTVGRSWAGKRGTSTSGVGEFNGNVLIFNNDFKQPQHPLHGPMKNWIVFQKPHSQSIILPALPAAVAVAVCVCGFWDVIHYAVRPGHPVGRAWGEGEA